MTNLNRMVRERCQLDADKTAFLVKRDGKWNPTTWGEVDLQVDYIAAGLLSLGLKKGDTVAILGNTRLEWTLCDLAIIRAGCISTGIYQTLTAAQSHYILRDSNARILILEDRHQLAKLEPGLQELKSLDWIVSWDEGLTFPNLIGFSSLKRMGLDAINKDREFVKRIETEIRPDNDAMIIYTSGTTGPPKGVCLSHRNILAEIESTSQLLSDEMIGEVMMFFLPLAHVGERVAGQFFRISRGIAAAYVNDMNNLLNDMLEIRPTFFGSVPRVFEKAFARILSQVENASPLKRKIFQWVESVGRAVSRLHQEGRPLPFWLGFKYSLADILVFKNIREIFGGRVRYFLSSSAPITREIIEFFHACGMLILEGYGQTEVSCFCTLCTPSAYRFGSVGKTMPNIALKIADDGEILIKGDIVFKGYLKQPDKTDEIFTRDGWLQTGDIGRLDEDGYLWITGRKKEIIITSAGRNIAPTNIEFLLMKHPLIEMAMVHGDRRDYLTALISISQDSIGIWAEKNGFSDLTYAECTRQKQLKQDIQEIIDNANTQLASDETIKRFELLSEPLLVETGELTPTMKVRRNIIEEKYAHLLDRMYSVEL